MSEQVAVNALPSLSELISEVFIKPIRTVMVVDDEYPTLDDFLVDDQQLGEKKNQNKPRVREILDVCRNPNYSWLVDVHDATSPAAHHLHHSDLMILDYHLEPFSNRGDKSINILRDLAKNGHFNLVIVYTAAGDGTGGDINQTVAEIALGLSSRNDELLKLPGRALEALQELLDQWSDHDPGIIDRLKEQIDLVTFLRLRWTDDLNFKQAVNGIELQGLQEIVSTASGHGLNIEAYKILKWLLHQVQEDLSDSLSPDDLGKVSFDIVDTGVNWIRTNTLFVTVLSKGNVQPKDLPQKLAQALESWDPLPQRLILSKMRTELDSTGVLAEDEVLSDRYLQADWLNDFLADADAETAGGITVDRHWESLGDAVRPKVVRYAQNLAKVLLQCGKRQNHNFEKLITLDFEAEKSKIHQHANRYACSKRVDGEHLSVGHILEINRNDGRDTSYWICLTPACDMVPGQKGTGWAKRLGGWLPFKAVQLFTESADEALKEANRANHLFVSIDGDLKVFAFSPKPAALNNPKWEQMFANNGGIFEDEDHYLTLSMLSGDEENGITSEATKARVVAQLRYEYALNLLQRLGMNLSRIGLDFKSYEADE